MGGAGHMDDRTTKERVFDAAIQLFFQKGFHATSTRDITNKIEVNGSLISYHFNGKQGLLEEIVVSYYEQLIDCMEKTMEQNVSLGTEQIKEVIEELFRFKYTKFYQSAVVHRELTLDSTFVREIVTTYIRKENYYLTYLFHVYVEQHPHLKQHIPLYVMQLKGMIMSPFLLHHEWKKDLFSRKVDSHMCFNYITHIHQWIDSIKKTNKMIQFTR